MLDLIAKSAASCKTVKKHPYKIMHALLSIQCALFHERGVVLSALEPSGAYCLMYLAYSVIQHQMMSIANGLL
jgi:hypothetical protein